MFASLSLDGPWRDALAELARGARIRVVGVEPLTHPDLHPFLEAVTAAGAEAELVSDLPGLDDDQRVRPLAPHAVRFHARVPLTDAEAFETLSGRPWADFRQALNNLRAFGYATRPLVPVTIDTVGRLADTLEGLTQDVGFRTVDVDVPPALAEAAGAQLLALSSRGLRPTPRVRVTGCSPLALPVEALVEVDVRVPPERADPMQPAPAGVDRDDVAKRRVWLSTKPEDRETHRGDPRDVLDDALSTVQLRDGHEVHLAIRRGDGRPALASAQGWDVHVHGRFPDETLQRRFAAVAKEAHARGRAADLDLAGLRALTQGIRRGLKPKHDGTPARWRAEGE